MYLCPRCHVDHGPEQICDISAEYCPKCVEEMKMTGYTFNEMMEGGRIAKRMLDEGKVPIEGTTKEDYMIVGDIAIYTPYIPLYITGDTKNERT